MTALQTLTELVHTTIRIATRPTTCARCSSRPFANASHSAASSIRVLEHRAAEAKVTGGAQPRRRGEAALRRHQLQEAIPRPSSTRAAGTAYLVAADLFDVPDHGHGLFEGVEHGHLDRRAAPKRPPRHELVGHLGQAVVHRPRASLTGSSARTSLRKGLAWASRTSATAATAPTRPSSRCPRAAPTPPRSASRSSSTPWVRRGRPWMSQCRKPSADQLLKAARLRRAMADGTGVPQRDRGLPGRDGGAHEEDPGRHRGVDGPAAVSIGKGAAVHHRHDGHALRHRHGRQGARHRRRRVPPGQRGISIGGGRKGANLPEADFEAQCQRFSSSAQQFRWMATGMGE